MFQALREYFGKDEDQPRPRRGRGRRLAALFVFEFVVVVLGVLAAQLLQDWFATRAEARRAMEAVAALDAEAKRFGTVAEYRVRADECETARLGRLMAIIRSGGSATEAEGATPIMPMPIITEWSDSTRAAVARHAPREALAKYDALALLARMISDRQRQLEDQWADFRLLAPEAQPLAAENRAALALAVARAQGLLAMIDMNAEYVARFTPGFKPEERTLKALAKMDHPCASAALVPVTAAGER